MGKIQNIITNLSRPPMPNTNGEIGTSADGNLPSIFEEEFVDMSKVQVEDFKKMLDEDSTIQALYNSIVTPLLGSNWTIEPDEDTPAAREQSEWVEDALRKPPHKGGMSTPFDLVIAQALRAIVEGFAGFEKVYEISEEGKLVYKKIAWRDPTTLTPKADERGGFNGLRQKAYLGTRYIDVTIPLERCWLYTYGKEFHNLRGRSMFTAAYAAYDKKKRLLYLAEIQAQSDALALKVVKGKDGANQKELNATTAAVDELGFKASIGIPFGYEVTALNNSGRMDLLPLIEFQNAEMARSVLAMFILLGTGKTGSWALSNDQSDFFIQALMSIRKSLENHITSYLLPDLYQYNFENPEYGTFKFEDITDSTVDLLKQTFIKLCEKDRLSDSVVDGVLQKVADKLDIDVDISKERADKQKEKEQNPPPVPPETPPAIPPAEPPMPPTSPVNNARGDMPVMDLPDGWRRDFTNAEKRVNFAGIENKMNMLEAETTRTITAIYDSLVEDATVNIGRFIDAGEYDKIDEKNVFNIDLKNQYIKALKEAGLDAYIYGKNGAADEMEVKSPTTPKESKDYFRDSAASIVEKQLSQLIASIQMEINKSRRKDQLSTTQLSVADVMKTIAEIFIGFNYDIGLTAIATVAIGINKGRKDVFEVYADDIYAYQYSAILDDRTCETCRKLDGKVLNYAAYKKTTYDPPIHFGCRCIWVEILKDETDPPPITGFDEVAGLLEPSLSQSTKEQIIELGRRAVQEEILRLLTEE